MNLIDLILKKRGVKPEELDEEEKQTIEGWRKILAADEIGLDEVTQLCSGAIDNIEAQFRDLDNTKEKIERLVLQHSIYSTIKSVIESPKAQREQLVAYLQTQL